ncbi:MAG TPA: signal recognition particle protein Srp19 [Thermoplasmata archaeon]|nr:signal recognition particle protein Srp19 [Thermoplasmata archaeon]
MASKDDGRQVLYPVYFDPAVSRRKGRRVSVQWAVEGIDVERIAAVAGFLGLHPTVEPDVRHPRECVPRGRVLVDAVQPKTRTIRIIAKRLRTGKY